MIYDITPLISNQLKVWPGDTPLSREILSDINQGDNITLSSIHATAHLGAHADAPNHYSAQGSDLSERSLDYYLGPCQVIKVKVARGQRILPIQIQIPIQEKRVLFATGSYPNPNEFNTDFAALSPEVIEMLHRQGVITIGIDTPSIDLFESKELPSHQTVFRYEMAILEGLILAEVPEGCYELIALPLKLQDFDASPVRAVLRSL
jgi:arylformamidase